MQVTQSFFWWFFWLSLPILKPGQTIAETKKSQEIRVVKQVKNEFQFQIKSSWKSKNKPYYM